MIFEFSKYRSFLKSLQSKGECVTFSEWDGSKSFLLRFDVDFDLKYACQLATINAEMGVKSTFFILTSCHFYNVLSSINRNYLNKIADTGAEIGLHFDPTVYSSFQTNELESKVDDEAYILSSVIGKKINAVSLHNPSVYNKFPVFPNYFNAYDERIFSDDKYVSDSRMLFRGKNIIEFIDQIQHTSVQIALHPMHYGETERKYPGIMIEHIVDYLNHMDEVFKVNSTYVEQVEGSMLSQFSQYLTK